MKLTIDTNNDSKEELKQIIKLLQNIIKNSKNDGFSSDYSENDNSSNSEDNNFSLGGLNFMEDDTDFEKPKNKNEDLEPEKEYKTIILD